MARVVKDSGASPQRVARIQVAVGQVSQITPLIRAIERQRHSEAWDRLAIHSITRTLRECALALTSKLAAAKEMADTPEAIEGALLRVEGIPGVRSQIEILLGEFIPVSAMFVVSERLRRAVSAITFDT